MSLLFVIDLEGLKLPRKYPKEYNKAEYLRFWFNLPAICSENSCQNLIIKSYPNGKYCSTKCRAMAERSRAKVPYHEEVRKCAECGKEFVWRSRYPTKVFCCKRCKDNVTDRRSYHNIKEKEPDRHKRIMDKNHGSRKEWERRNKDEGRCSRCGKSKITENLLCSDCYRYLKERDVR